MNRLPSCLVIVDLKKEKYAIREARLMGITTCALIDTDCNPDDVDLPIPGNDDGIRSIELIMSHISDAVVAGGKALVAKKEGEEKAAAAVAAAKAAAAKKAAEQAKVDAAAAEAVAAEKAAAEAKPAAAVETPPAAE